MEVPIETKGSATFYVSEESPSFKCCTLNMYTEILDFKGKWETMYTGMKGMANWYPVGEKLVTAKVLNWKSLTKRVWLSSHWPAAHPLWVWWAVCPGPLRLGSSFCPWSSWPCLWPCPWAWCLSQESHQLWALRSMAGVRGIGMGGDMGWTGWDGIWNF